MSTPARRLATLERRLPPATTQAAADGIDADRYARILALMAGDAPPDGLPVSEADARTARLLRIMRDAKMTDDDGADGAS